MKIANAFRVDLPVEEAWTTLLDAPSVVPCMPGAELIAAEDERTFRGRVRVKLGPVAVAFEGRARLDEVDAAARTVRVKASGNEAKGRGSAQADVVFRLQPDGAGTRVDIATDLALAGAVAQYGRAQGVIADTAQVIIDAFATNLRAKIAARTPPAGATAEAPSPEVPRAPALSLVAVLLALVKRWFARLHPASR